MHSILHNILGKKLISNWKEEDSEISILVNLGNKNIRLAVVIV